MTRSITTDSSARRLPRLLTAMLLIAQATVTTTVLQELLLSTPGHRLSQPAQAQSDPAQRVYNKAHQAVVFIETYDQNGQSTGSGSGIVVESDGLIVTNAHVVQGAAKVVVELSNQQRLTAQVVSLGGSKCMDLALLQVKPNLPLHSLKLASRPVQRGQHAYAIGYPRGITPSSITQGIISNLYEDDGMIQTDESLNPGNSGGALLNQKGELVGIGKGGFRDTQGMNLAVSGAAVQGFLQAYRQQLSPKLGQGVVLRSELRTQSLAFNGKAVQGRLQSDDHLVCGDRSRADLYTFEGKAGQPFMLSMFSSELKPYLILQDSQGRVVAKGGKRGQEAAQLLGRLPADGTYTLLANSEQPDEAGRYAISASMPLLARNDEIHTSLPSCFSDGSRCLSYQFDGTAQQEIAIEVTAGFAPYVELADPQGNKVSTGTGKPGKNRLMVKLPKTGTYRLRVSTNNPQAKGQFQVVVHDGLSPG